MPPGAWSTRRPTACRPSTASACTPTPRACASASWASTTASWRRRSRSSAPVTEELEGQADVSVLIRCIPLIDHGAVSGAVVLTRDVSELRRRDRLLLSKDATIREIHHRVKNNLQTISSLLRLAGPAVQLARGQGGHRGVGAAHPRHRARARDAVAGGRATTWPSWRSCARSLAWSRRGCRRRTARCASRWRATPGSSRPPSPRRCRWCSTSSCRTPSTTRSRRASTSRPSRGGWWSRCENDGVRLQATVVDDGVGLPEGFSLDAAAGLGLSIVRTLVTSELAGTISLERGTGDGDRPGTIVRLDVPVATARVTPAASHRHVIAQRPPAGEQGAEGQESGGRAEWLRRCGAGERRTACGAGGAPPRRCRPTRRSPGWW